MRSVHTTYWLRQGLTIRSANALANDGIYDLDQLKKMTCEDLLAIPNFGPVCLREVQKAIGWPEDIPAPTTIRVASDVPLIVNARGNRVIMELRLPDHEVGEFIAKVTRAIKSRRSRRFSIVFERDR